MQNFTFLTIAGSDSGGGAGIQADLKTATILGGYAASVITALTAQNTCKVSGIHAVPAEFVKAQLVTVLEDIKIDVIKSGMLLNTDIIEVIAPHIPDDIPYILDPVMISKSGAKLLNDQATSTLITKLCPKALIVTPNLPEMQILCGGITHSHAQSFINKTGCQFVLIKGGHSEDTLVTDTLISKDSVYSISKPRIVSTAGHGTGCTMASALACYCAMGFSPQESLEKSKEYVYQALYHADCSIGSGSHPLKHNFNL